MEDLLYMTNGFFDNVADKLCWLIFVFFGFHVTGIHEDITLVSILLKLMVADFTIGLASAAKCRVFSYKTMIRGLFKFPLYGLYLFFVACVDQMIFKYTGVNGGWCVKLFLAYLVVCEIYSMISNLGGLGIKVPPLLVYLANRLKEVIEYRGKGSIDKVIGKSPMEEKKESDNENLR